MKYLDEIKKTIRESNLNVEGSSNIEIDKAEKDLGLKFPIVYREFLSILGNKSDEVFCGDIIDTKDLLSIQHYGQTAFKQAIGKRSPSNCLFILDHQSYSFYYFMLNGSENPDLYLLIFGDEITNKKTGKLKDMLYRSINLHKTNNKT